LNTLTTSDNVKKFKMTPMTKERKMNLTKSGTKRIEDREIDELIGVCRGILADGAICTQEANFLLSWLQRNTTNIDLYPFDILTPRLISMLEDGRLDIDEELELIDLFLSVLGEPIATTNKDINLATSMPYTIDNISDIAGNKFCLTGQFKCAQRKEIEREIVLRRGTTSKTPTKDTQYLVIGNIGSNEWAHSSFGRKIEQAIRYKKEGSHIEIVGEEHLVSHLNL
jgi:NAD-dependent DNA ligase